MRGSDLDVSTVVLRARAIFASLKNSLVQHMLFPNCTRNHAVLRGSNSKKNFFVCFNAMQFIFGQVLGHGTTNIKISFSKLPLPWLPC